MMHSADVSFYMNRFAAFDKDKSGSLSLYEFLEVCVSVCVCVFVCVPVYLCICTCVYVCV